MKKTLIVLYGFLVIAAAAGLWGNRNGLYLGERALWNLSREYDAIVKNTTGTPTHAYQEILDKLARFVRRYSPHKGASVGYILRGRLLTIQGEHELAKKEIDAALNTFQDDEEIVIQLLLEQAQMYAIQGDSEGVADMYRRISTEHPLTRYGMQGPLILAKYFVKKRDTVRAKEAYIEAIDHYHELIGQYPDSQVEFQSRLLLAECFKSLEDWDKVLELHQETLLKFAKPDFWTRESLLYVIQAINNVTILQRGDFATPRMIYATFIKQYPDHPFNDDLSEFIRRIEYMESQTVSKDGPSTEQLAPPEASLPDPAPDTVSAP